MKKRLKLPNGYGSITERSDCRRRNPFVVKVTIAGKQKAIGYVASYEAGLTMLADYHRDPMKFVTNTATFSQVYQLMAAEKYPNIAALTVKNYESAYKHCSRIYSRRFAELRPADLQQVITDVRDSGAGQASQRKVRQVMHHCYTYAIKYEIIGAAMDYSEYVDIDKHVTRVPKNPFNTRQLNSVRKLIVDEHQLARWAT